MFSSSNGGGGIIPSQQQQQRDASSASADPSSGAQGARKKKKRWSSASDAGCLAELRRRTWVACAWRPSFRRAISYEEPRVGCRIQCFHNRLTGFADWARLERTDDGRWVVVLFRQVDARDVATRQFSRRELLELGELLDRYEEMRVNDVEAIEEEVPANADALAEVERRVGREVRPGDVVLCDGSPAKVSSEFALTKQSDGRAVTLKDVMDALSIISVDDSKPKFARPPPKRASAANRKSAEEEEREMLERRAQDLFVPVIARSRRERDDLDRQASAAAAQFSRADFADFDAESWLSARRAAGKALRTSFTGIHLRRPADVLYDALIAEKLRKPWIAEPNPVVAVAGHIARASLRDPTTAPSAVLALVTDSFFGTKHQRREDLNHAVAADDLVARALASARLVLDALLRYHPALAETREATVTSLECVDALILGDDIEEEEEEATVSLLTKDSWTPTRRRRRQRRPSTTTTGGGFRGDEDDEQEDPDLVEREVRYQAVVATLRAQAARVDLVPYGGDDDGDDEDGRGDRNDANIVVGLFSTTKKRPVSASVIALRKLPKTRTARGKLRVLVATLEAIASELGDSGVASDDLMPALCDTIVDAKLQSLAAEIAFAKQFNRDEKLLLGAEGYALTSFEIALVALQKQQQDDANAKEDAATPH